MAADFAIELLTQDTSWKISNFGMPLRDWTSLLQVFRLAALRRAPTR
jgi:hypothetical protein